MLWVVPPPPGLPGFAKAKGLAWGGAYRGERRHLHMMTCDCCWDERPGLWGGGNTMGGEAPYMGILSPKFGPLTLSFLHLPIEVQCSPWLKATWSCCFDRKLLIITETQSLSKPSVFIMILRTFSDDKQSSWPLFDSCSQISFCACKARPAGPRGSNSGPQHA